MAKQKRKRRFLSRRNQTTLLAILFVLFVFGFYQYNRNFKPKASTILLSQNEPDRIHFSKLNVNLPIEYSSEVQDNNVGDITGKAVHLDQTANIGEIGNVFLVLPSQASDESTPQPGDNIVLTHDLKHFTYVVYETRVVAPTELWITSQITDNQSILTLETPISGDKSRQKIIALAKLQD